MDHFSSAIHQLDSDGFAVMKNIYTDRETVALLRCIESAESHSDSFRKTNDLFAIRRFLQEVPAIGSLLFTPALRSVVRTIMGQDYFIVKSIYFDKPAASNWFVAYHQDLTISVAGRKETAGYGPWRVKPNQFAVQPPVALLELNYTIRIHLDDTTADNGALKVMAGSHAAGIRRTETIDRDRETICEVPQGGIMLMKPLLFHASGRSSNARQRRVIHLEFSNQALPEGLEWAEKQNL